MNKNISFEIIVGTYEEFVVGYKYNKEGKNKELTQSFASHSHTGSVRCVTHSGHYLATGGADDRIIIYDLKSRKEHCMLTHHNSTVNCLQFTEGHTHLISGGSDGVLAITRVANWHLEKIWDKAHDGLPIIEIAIHPSNKLALTLGADSTLRTWNLIKGRKAYVINLNSKVKYPKSLQFIKWAPDGVRFVLGGGSCTDVWSIQTGGVVKPLEHKNKISYCLFYNNDTLIVGFENGHLCTLNLNDNSSKEIEAHTARIKTIDICKRYLVTCSSNGEIKMWTEDLEEVISCNMGCRATCMCVVLPIWIKKEDDDDNDVAEETKIIEENDCLEMSNKFTDGTVTTTRKKKFQNNDEVLVNREISRKKRKHITDIVESDSKANSKQLFANKIESVSKKKEKRKAYKVAPVKL